MAEGAERKKLHALMISPPYQGHINPMVNLAIKLASSGVSVTFINFEHIHQKLCHAHGPEVDLFSEARKSGFDIRYETLNDVFPLEFDRELLFDEYIKGIIEDFPNIVDQLLQRKMAEVDSVSNWVTFVVYDTVHFWIPKLAQKYKIVNVSLWTEPALVFNLIHNVKLLQENLHFPCKDDVDEEIRYIPGISSINTKDLMSFMRKSQASGVIAMLLFKAFEQVDKADFILHNTVEELELEVLSKLNEDQPNYAIGPLNSVEALAQLPSLKKSLWPEFDCSQWLRSKKPDSVLYVSFGSFVHLSKDMIDEIAHGILLSGVNFLWVLRTGILNNGDILVLPEEMQKINDKGMVIPWCNQIKVLSDDAVGGFLTHNGWNSTIESMWCGVPMLCFPFLTDQITNRKLVVEDWSIGLNLCDGKSVNRTEVAEKIKTLFLNDKVKQNARKVKKIMHEAVQAGGSSNRNFNQFMDDLRQKCIK